MTVEQIEQHLINLIADCDELPEADTYEAGFVDALHKVYADCCGENKGNVPASVPVPK